MTVYADSSFIVSVILPSPEAGPALALWEDVESVPLPFNPIHRLEVRNALRRAEHHGRIDHHTTVSLLRELEADLGRDFVHQALDWTRVLATAEDLGARHAAKTGVRAYDLFHLAAAVVTGHDTLLTFDQVQADTARLMGLTVPGR